MRGLLLASALLLAATASCSDGDNRLYGSASEVLDLAFDETEVSLVGNYLVIEYLRGPETRRVKVIKLSLDMTAMQVVPGEKIDLSSRVGQASRGTLQRIVEGTVDLPLERGTLVLDNVPAHGKPLSGHFRTILAEPAGRTLNGDFSAQVAAP
ncbi:MAG: hypothetical protein HY698_06790 [Deltaproteobacteria bacterium]|nr:hypothetical protein [Deltaproteobacteria bacterium]